jgi:hypothetical protein
MRAWSSEMEIVRVRRSSAHQSIIAHHPDRQRAASPRPHHPIRATRDPSQLNRNL